MEKYRKLLAKVMELDAAENSDSRAEEAYLFSDEAIVKYLFGIKLSRNLSAEYESLLANSVVFKQRVEDYKSFINAKAFKSYDDFRKYKLKSKSNFSKAFQHAKEAQANMHSKLFAWERVAAIKHGMKDRLPVPEIKPDINFKKIEEMFKPQPKQVNWHISTNLKDGVKKGNAQKNS